MNEIVVYGADWCPDCRRIKSYLNDNGITVLYVEVDEHDWATGGAREDQRRKADDPDHSRSGHMVCDPR